MKIFWLVFLGIFLICNIICLIWILREGKKKQKSEKIQDGEYEEFMEWYKNKKEKK